MMEIRDRYLEHFRATAREIFAKKAELRSVVLSVSQYWDDEADDAVHEWIVASERELPLWPHLCDRGFRGGEDPVENVPGELCTRCADVLDDRGWLEWWHDNGEAIAAFEAFCHEAGSQNDPASYNALPAAIARKRGGDVEVMLLGPVQRPHAILGSTPRATGVTDPTWADARAVELYEQVCASPADDGPRRVLADYLLEREIPRGELIAHALAGSPEYATRLADHRATWLDPLTDIIVVDTARIDRGFLAEAELFAVDRAHRGHPVLASLERLYVHFGSASVLHPAMRALREVGPINRTWLEDLVAASRPWAIETLDVDLSDEDMVAMLAATAKLPALRHLIVRSNFVELAVHLLTEAAWWRQLERLTIVDLDGAPHVWHGRHSELAVPWLAVRTEYRDPVKAEGWELAFGPGNACEVTLRGFTPEATREALKQLLATIPVRAVKLVASRHYTPAAIDAAYLSRDGQLVT
ncbi:MAG TPA: hypothetical protein VFQ65_31510 [Kofleriaceae bacterium]|nr:hypothetical protein [Kofleriaceae bacterium]